MSRVYGLPDGFHRTAEVASDHIGRYDDFPFHVFAAYRIGTRGGFDVGDVAERYLRSVAVYQQVAYLLYRVPAVVGYLDRQVEGIVAFVDLRYGLSGQCRSDVFVELRHG